MIKIGETLYQCFVIDKEGHAFYNSKSQDSLYGRSYRLLDVRLR